MRKGTTLILILAIYFLSFARVVVAQEAETVPPATGETEILSAQAGAALSEGWNYFTPNTGECTAEQILNELQADAGGAITANKLWVKRDDQWEEVVSAKEAVSEAQAKVDAEQIIAFYAPAKFFFDLDPQNCQIIDSAREEQILGLRAAAQNKDGSGGEPGFLQKLTEVPLTFWYNMLDALGIGGKKEANISVPELTVLGKTVLGDVGITGNLTLGLLSVESIEKDTSSSIETLSGPLKLQSRGLGNIDIFGDKIKLDKNGDLAINEGVIRGSKKFRGEVVIKMGKTEIRVEREWESAPAAVNLTPTFNAKVWVEELSKEGFVVKLDSASNKEEKVYWIAIW